MRQIQIQIKPDQTRCEETWCDKFTVHYSPSGSVASPSRSSSAPRHLQSGATVHRYMSGGRPLLSAPRHFGAPQRPCLVVYPPPMCTHTWRSRHQVICSTSLHFSSGQVPTIGFDSTLRSKARDSRSQSIFVYFAFGFMDTRGNPSRSARRCFLRSLFKLEAGRQNPCKEKGYRPKTGGLKIAG